MKTPLHHAVSSPLTLGLVAVVFGVSFGTAQEPKKSTAPREKWSVAIVVHEDVELLDFAGPGEVFSASGSSRPFQVFTVAESAQPIKSQRFLTITPQYTIANCPKPDIVVIPGGATVRLLRSPAMMKWIKDSAANAEIMFSVCTGAFVLAEAGLLDGLEATTHYGSIAGLKRYEKIKVCDDRRVVDNGKIVTAAGVSAGIDGALHIVGRLCGQDTAKSTAKYMEYRWEPVTPKTEDQTPEVSASHAWFAGKWPEVEKVYQQFVTERPTDGVALYRLGISQLRQRKLEEGINNLTSAIQNGHRDGETVVQIGLAQMRMKKTDDALKSYEQALELGFHEWPVYFDLARLYALTGKKSKAAVALDNAFSAGMVGIEQVLLEPDFDMIRGLDPFRKIIKKYCFDSRVRMVTDKEPGDPMIVSGIVRDATGQPLPNVLVYLYHTDVNGIYNTEKTQSSRIFAYLRTDGLGRFEIRSIRPAAYPNANIPQHVHWEVYPEGKPAFHGEFFFADDSKLSAGDRQLAENEKSLVSAKPDKDGIQRGTVELRAKR